VRKARPFIYLMKTEILGVRIDNLTMNQALQRIEGFLTDGRQHYIVTPNPEFLILAQKDRRFRRILNQADLAIPDGVGLIFASWFLRQPLKRRVAGTDLMEKICQRAASREWPVFLVGGQTGTAEKATANLKSRYPGLKIGGCSFGGDPFDYKDLQTEQNRPDLADRTSQTGPLQSTILFVALRMPKQEKWIAQNLAKLPSVRLAIGVGGAFNFISGRVRRAPRPFRLAGLEWLWRLGRQPWRIKRIFRAVVVFPWLVIRSKK
jgi:N-acetylglucosaminyldiphosphoundecaprenol N-acetyl-beta-D-mannosaminyltransferase